MAKENNQYVEVFPMLMRVALSGLIALILAAIAVGIIKTVIDLVPILDKSLEEILKKVIVNILIILALVEMYKTAYIYFSEGRVRVTYIVDTVLVVMFSEIISSWFKNEDLQRIIVLLAILFSLIIIRILAIRFHPKREE